MSTRRPACAPPPKIWICGSGISWQSRSAEIAVQRLAGGGGGGVRGRHRHRQHRVAAEPRLARRAVQFDQPAVQRRLVGGVEAGHGAGDLAVHVADRARHVVAAERRRRRRAGRAPRRCRWRRRPGRWRGRRRRLPAAPPPPPSGGRGCPTRGGRARRRSRYRSCGKLLRPGLAHRRRGGRPGAASNARAVRRTRSLSGSAVMYSTGDLPSTRARNSPGSRCAARASSAAGGSQSTPAR